MDRRTILVYVAGPYSAENESLKQNNINLASAIAQLIWEMGYAAICPHLNTRDFEIKTKVPYDGFISGCITMLERCDIAYFLPNWKYSPGARVEMERCIDLGIPVVFNLEELERIGKSMLEAKTIMEGEHYDDH